MSLKVILQTITMVSLSINAFELKALDAQHLIVVRAAQAEHDAEGFFHSNPKHPHYRVSNLTLSGKEQVNQIAEQLLSNGFDNRNIAAVFVSPLPSAVQTAQALAKIGVFSKRKIVIDKRLTERKAGQREGDNIDANQPYDQWISTTQAKLQQAESNLDVHQRIVSLLAKVKNKKYKGHVLAITHGIPALILIEELSHHSVLLAPAQIYLIPLNHNQPHETKHV